MKSKITVAEVRKGIKIGKFKLARKTYCNVGDNGHCYGCILTALYCLKNNCELGRFIYSSTSISMWAVDEYGGDYVDGIVGGFDARMDHKFKRKNYNDEQWQGILDARRIRRYIFKGKQS